jgi:hypothetical protein
MANQIELEETVVNIPSCRAFYVYLDRHRNMISDQTQLYGPLREDSEVWEEHLMQLPEGSEGSSQLLRRRLMRCCGRGG